jgi:hypothetical protein
MAALIGEVHADSGRTDTHRIAHREIKTRAATWHTAADVYLNKDGSGYLEVWQNSALVHRYEWGPEMEKPAKQAA